MLKKTISVLLSLTILLGLFSLAAVEAGAAGDTSAYVADARNETFNVNGYNGTVKVTYRIPKILLNSDDAKNVNTEILNTYSDNFKDAANQGAFEETVSKSIDYEAYTNGSVLSVVITNKHPQNSVVTYSVYNFDISSGKQLDNKALAEKMNVKWNDVKAAVADAVKADFKNVSLSDKFSKECYDKSLSDSNLEASDIYIGKNNTLEAVYLVYWIAGASKYYHVADLKILPVIDLKSCIADNKNETVTAIDKNGKKAEFKYRTPKILINSEDAALVNKEIDDVYNDYLNRAKTAGTKESFNDCMKSIDYEAYLNGSVLSVLIKYQYYYTSQYFYGVYNLDVYTGDYLVNEDITESIGSKWSDVRYNVKDTIYADVNDWFAKNGKGMDISGYLEKNTTDDNIDYTNLYLAENKELMGAFRIYLPVQGGTFYKIMPINTEIVYLSAGSVSRLIDNYEDVERWTNSDRTVARMKAGVAYGFKKGLSRITAYFKDGSTKVFYIIVRKNPKLKISGKTFSKSKTYKIKRNKTITVKISGKVPNTKNTYKSSNKRIAKVISKRTAKTVKIKGYRRGKATVAITVNGVKYKIKVKVK